MPLLETGLYELSKVFLTPVLFLIVGAFVFSLASLGGFSLEVLQRWRRRHHSHLLAYWRRHPGSALEDLELEILRRLEPLRITTRTAPMLGLVATMIPMGPALTSLADGNSQGISENLVIAFAAVIVALLAASMSFLVLTVRRRWMLHELRCIERQWQPEKNRSDAERPAVPVQAIVGAR